MRIKNLYFHTVLAVILAMLLNSIQLGSCSETGKDSDLCSTKEEEICKANKDGNTYCCQLSKSSNVISEITETISMAKCCSEFEFYGQFPSLDSAKAEPRYVFCNISCCFNSDFHVKLDCRSIVRGLAKLIGYIVGAAVLVIIVCCVCCFCCPFCLLSKHKRGRVIRRNEDVLQDQQPSQPPPPPNAQQYAPVNPGYPPQQDAAGPYPPPQAQGYPGYPPQTAGGAIGGYPEQPPPYPGPPLAEAPPLQTKANPYDQQPAYNPSAP